MIILYFVILLINKCNKVNCKCLKNKLQKREKFYFYNLLYYISKNKIYNHNLFSVFFFFLFLVLFHLSICYI
ncbi:hypothetical protein BCR32DRAFT_107665 [Anaeromyces robustus]|uniref:Uncharacterized protein n=1 Tax=Anaeromyces robustus TaxID=1754192 RepID=A0A1Y1W5E4_9FUNG|nr:hypothetical protein BCR32DRAFT_107665 [Anaeromyces robustus]|eukprot:ORX68446.1 hypothetical protein BCR32DRAFT_107665 [Anaeromyces robustus]